MRIMPLLTAALVAFALYMVVLQRDELLAFAQVERDAPAEAEAIAAASDAQPRAGEVSVVALRSTAEVVDSAVVLRGRTEAARQVEVRAETSGQVVSDPLRKGAFVEEGDLLCELDPGTRTASLDEARARLDEARARLPEAEAGLAGARAQLNEAEINQNAASRLSQDGFASETTVASRQAQLESARAGVESANAAVQSARAGIQSAQAAVAAAERQIEWLSVEAPFAGLLETDAAELGSLLQPGSPCATILQLDPIRLVGFVPEADVAKIETGAQAGARLGSGDEVQGAVTFLSRAADEATRTFRVEVTVPNTDLAIRDGQSAEILIRTDGRDAHLLPQSSLTLNDDGDLGVRTVDEDNTARFMPVTLLRDTAEGVWVAGLPETVDVIVVGQEFVIDGVPVTPTFREREG